MADKPVAVASVPPAGNHSYVYTPLPPLTDTEADPLEPPLQLTSDCVDDVTIGSGSEISGFSVVIHPFASMMVQV